MNPPWFRRPLYDMLDELSQEEPDLLTMKLKDLHPASWFCVAWYPLYRIPDAPLVTRFLTFHSFHPPRQEASLVCQGGSVPLAVFGLEWYNMTDELWMDNIKIVKDSRSSTPSRSNNTSWIAHEGTVLEIQNSVLAIFDPVFIISISVLLIWSSVLEIDDFAFSGDPVLEICSPVLEINDPVF